MAEFSESDIEAAKRRVKEMRNRANRFKADEHVESSAVQKENCQGSESAKEADGDDETVQDKSFVIILALILILSKEGADNKLILALLYLLL